MEEGELHAYHPIQSCGRRRAEYPIPLVPKLKPPVRPGPLERACGVDALLRGRGKAASAPARSSSNCVGARRSASLRVAASRSPLVTSRRSGQSFTRLSPMEEGNRRQALDEVVFDALRERGGNCGLRGFDHLSSLWGFTGDLVAELVGH